MGRVQAIRERAHMHLIRYRAAGQGDLAARPIAKAFERILGKPVVVDNRGGAGGALGNAQVARCASDGHTLRMREAMADPDTRRTFEAAGSPPAYLDQPEFAAFVASDSARLIEAVRKIGKVDGG
jgi:tripartite-type tricarboxylate transporter receptor subunit TctC